jgi:transposase-like protein
VRTIFAQPDPESARHQLRQVVGMLEVRYPQAAELLDDAEADVASTPTWRDMSSIDSPRNSCHTTSIFRFADHRGRDRWPWDSLFSTDMSVIVAPLYRLSTNPGCGGAHTLLSGCHIRARCRSVFCLD